jgi:hypothetical protein
MRSNSRVTRHSGCAHAARDVIDGAGERGELGVISLGHSRSTSRSRARLGGLSPPNGGTLTCWRRASKRLSGNKSDLAGEALIATGSGKKYSAR